MHNEHAVYAQALNLIDTFAQKHLRAELNEFEYKLYEKLCNAMAMYFGGLSYAFQISSMKTEMECKSEEVAYLAFIAQLDEARRLQEQQERENEKKPPEEPTTEV